MRQKRLNFAALLLLVMLSFTACQGSVSETSKTPVPESGVTVGSENPSEIEKDLEPEHTVEGTELLVHYIDIGQGDATLITCDGEAMLIDAGDNDKGTAVQSYLNSQNITSLDYVIGTHPDADHIGGMDVILTKFDCKNIFLTEEEKDTATYRDVKDAMRYKNYKQTAPRPGEQYTLGSAAFTILGPTELCDDSNDNSIAILLEHGKNRFYFEGDASEKEEEDILGTGLMMQADVYKVGHHGSKTSTSDELLTVLDPDFAVISVGEGNSYGHPSAEVLNKLRGAQIQIFRTDEQGTIVAVSDGSSISWNCSPTQSWQAGEPGASFDASSDDEAEAKEEEVQTQPQEADLDEVTVHITKSGKKYHQSDCGYLKDSDIEITLEDARLQGYEPCQKCN